MNAHDALDFIEGLLGLDTVPDYHTGAVEAVAIIATALDERDALRDALLDIEALADRDKQRHDGAEVFVEALLPDILILARAALKEGDPS